MSVTYVSSLVIYTGADFTQTFVLEDAQSNSFKDLTGASACAQMKRYESSKKTEEFTISFGNNRTEGKLTISLTSTQTAALKAGKYFYDILLNEGSKTTRVIEGTVLVKKAVTR